MTRAIDWESRRLPPELRDDEIHVWRCHLATGGSARPRLVSYLGDDERRRAERFRFERDRNRYVGGRGALRVILACYLQVAPADLAFRYGKQNKPELAPDGCGRFLGFNLSHSDDLAICAVGWNRNIGVDVEKIRADVRGEDLARRYFSAGELQSLLQLAPDRRAEGFFTCWTRKEAYVKARGDGLNIPLDSFDVTLDPGAAARVLRGSDPSWRMVGFTAQSGFPAALVHDGPPADLRFLALELE
jgi:4'-phosphopantetheinyl transferase